MSDEHDDFDGEPAHELSEGEPQTPNWVPVLGLGLFLVVGIYAVSGLGDDEETAAASAAASASAAAAAAAEAPTPAPTAPPERRAVPRPPPSALPNVDPETARRIREQIEELRKQKMEEQ